MSRKLSQQHFDFLKSQQTLLSWAGLTLEERCKMFHRKFPDKILSPVRLFRIYRVNSIRRKAVKRFKQGSPTQASKRLDQQK